MGERYYNIGLEPPRDTNAETTGPNLDALSSGLAPPPRPPVEPSPQILRDVAEAVRDSFVRAIGKPGLVLIEIDPHRLHAFWTVSREAMESARQQLGDGGATASMTLRVVEDEGHGDGSMPGAAFDVDVGGLRSRSYVDVFGDARRYRAFLGLRSADNRFVTLATSNPVELPPVSSAGSNAVRQIDVQAPENGIFDLQPSGPDGQAGTALHFSHAPRGETAPARFPLPPGSPGVSKTPWSDGSPETVAEPSPGESAPGTEVPAARPPLVLEQALTSSSYGLGRGGGFEVAAELHVYGHADPDQELRLFGRAIPLRPDGSFSIRRLLPNDPSLIEALLDSDDASTDRGDG